MFDLDRWQEIWITITQKKSRSFLTGFGVFWGMLILILMVGTGRGIENGLMAQVEGYALNSGFIWAQQTTLPYKGFQKGRTFQIKMTDIATIKSKIPSLEYVSPVVQAEGIQGDNVNYNNKSGTYMVQGIYPVNNNITKANLLHGRYINDLDIDGERKVCVIGKRIYEELFPKGEDPIGKQIRVNGIYLSVAGVMGRVASSDGAFELEELIFIPITTMQKAYNIGNIISFLAFTASSNTSVSEVEKDIFKLLKELHDISPDDVGAFGSFNVEESFKTFQNLLLGISILIWIVGLGTLFAGSIGVSNIMLVTVRERTKEIGIRRALGATPKQIIGQILTESAFLTLLSGMGGIIIGVGILFVIDLATINQEVFIRDPQITLWIAICTLLILSIIGIFTGLIPAKKAVQIKPIDAIREE